MIKLIIFDLDGTLANTITDIRDGLNAMLSELGFQAVTTEQTLSNINNGALELVRRSLPKEKRANEDFVKYAKKIYDQKYALCYDNRTEAYEGCKEALLKLSELGITLAVLSNKQDLFVKQIVKKLFSCVNFAFVLGQSEQFPTKPAPDAILYILNSLGTAPSEAALVGDSNIDMITAKNAGVSAVGVSWGYRDKDILIENGAQLIIDDTSKISDIPKYLI